MKFYIDFDHTLYNTNNLKSDMVNSVATYILKNGNFEQFTEKFKQMYPSIEPLTIKKDLNSITQILYENFKRPEETMLKIEYNIYSLIDTFGKLFSCNCNEMKNNIKMILDNGKNYLYNDSQEFLENLKKQGHELYILSHERYDLSHQSQKIRGSGILKLNLLDAAILTKKSKASLDESSLKDPNMTSILSTENAKQIPNSIDYKHGIFLDDRPKDLENLYNTVYKNQYPPFKVRIYRIARPNGTYSTRPYSNPKYKNGIQTVNDLKTLFQSLYSKQQSQFDAR